MIFKDRKHAGILLASKLLKYRALDPLILALPRGGAPIAAEVASRLETPWHLLMVRKIGAPFHSELAIGAICENDVPYFNEKLISQMGLHSEDIERIVQSEKREVQRQILKFRAGKKLVNLKNRTVIVIDDGLATGTTMLAAIRSLKNQGVSKLIVATPVTSMTAAAKVRAKVDAFVTIEERDDLLSVGSWYEDFSPIQDEEILSLIKHPIQTEKGFEKEEFMIKDRQTLLKGDLTLIRRMKALIIFSHASGNSRINPRNQMIASSLNSAGFGTYVLDLLTQEEFEDRENVFDMTLLSRRLSLAHHQLRRLSELADLPFGYLGASTGAGAALVASSQLSTDQHPPFAVVSRGGRVDLAGIALRKVRTPTLLIVGERDPGVLELNEEAQQMLDQSELVIIPGATHLFEEAGTLEQVAQEAAVWFTRHCPDHDLEENAPMRHHNKPSEKTHRPH